MQLGTRCRGWRYVAWQAWQAAVKPLGVLTSTASSYTSLLRAPADCVPTGSGPLRSGHTPGQRFGRSAGPELTFCALMHSKVQILFVFLFCALGHFQLPLFYTNA